MEARFAFAPNSFILRLGAAHSRQALFFIPSLAPNVHLYEHNQPSHLSPSTPLSAWHGMVPVGGRPPADRCLALHRAGVTCRARGGICTRWQSGRHLPDSPHHAWHAFR